jgi:glycosyltransferase involved in cell wall biosynthesis
VTTASEEPQPGVGSRPWRICHVITRLDLGGAQQNTLHSVRNHDRNAFRVELVAGGGGLLDADARSIRDAEIRLVPWLLHRIAPVRDAIATARLTAHFRRTGPDLVHTHSSKAGILAREAARRARVPAVVHTVHGWSFNDWQSVWRRRLYVALERRAARRTDAIVVVAEADRVRGLRHGIGEAGRYHVIRSGIDVDSFRPRPGDRERARRDLGIGDGEILVGTVANMKPQKAPLDFIDAAERILREEPRARFAFAGDGPLRVEVERAIEARGLTEAVRLLGWVRDPRAVLHALDVFLLTSRFEGLPRSVLQAMATGVPVVATAVDGTPEVVADGETGLLVPPGDPEPMAAAVVRMIREPALRRRCTSGARDRLTGSFDVHIMVRDLDGLYRGLLEGRGRAAGRSTNAASARRT